MGLFDFFGTKKDSGRDAGNPLNLNANDAAQAQGQLGKFLNYSADPNVTGTGASDYATGQVQNNPMLGQLFGKGGTLDQTTQEASDLAKRGYSLKPEDYEAYGQASDNLAREFGSAGGSLAQALSDRGLSSSGVAGQAYSGLQGSKLEQLGQVQRQIAQDRMNMNLQRLGQTRQFLTNLSGQGENAIQGQWGRNMQGEQQNFNEAQAKNNAAYQRLAGMSEQSNENLQQRQETERQAPWAVGLQSVGNFGGDLLTSAMGGKPTNYNNQRGVMSDNTTSQPNGLAPTLAKAFV